MGEAEVVVWSRQRLLAVVAALAVFCVVLLFGLVYAVRLIVGTPAAPPVAESGGSSDAGSSSGNARRDEIASAPMLRTRDSDLKPTRPAERQNPPIQVPLSTTVGPAGIDSGYPHTPEGAIAQLATIDTFALESMSALRAEEIFTAWADPAAAFNAWQINQSIRLYHSRAGTEDADPKVRVHVDPVAAQIKGTDGAGWLVACVQYDVSITYRSTGRFGFGHCDRMTWDGDRWVIGAGAPAAPAPSTWPASQRSVDAGWRPWIDKEMQ